MTQFNTSNNTNLLEHLLTVNRRLAEMRDLDELLTYMLEEVLQLVGAEWGYVVLTGEDGQLDFRAQRKAPDTDTDLPTGSAHGDSVSRSILRNVIQSGQSLVVEDAMFDPRFQSTQSVQDMQLRSIMCVPLITQNRTIGAIYLENRTDSGQFSEDDLAPLEFFNHHVAVTIENANLVANLEGLVAERTEELLQAKQEAEAANKAKGKFLANMSHELRSPLHAVLGFTRLAQREPNIDANTQEYLNIVHRSGTHLLTLINQVLDISKIEADRMTVHKRHFDLFRLLHDIEDMFQLRVQDKNLTFISQQATDLPRFIRTDDVKLRQVLINLVSNAVKFTAVGSITLAVKLVTTSDQPRLSCTVTDTGAGIPAEQLAEIFDAFVQAKTGWDNQEGTGLGLTISRSFVQLMGGELEIESTVGQGTQVYFDLPVEIVDGNTDTAQHTEIGQRVVGVVQPETPYRILVVDDRWSARHLLVKFLEPLGFEVREAMNGEEAVSMWAAWKPHLIWMDMHMPILNGWDATKQIKQTAEGANTIILALTASVLEEERMITLQAGCDDYLRKPFRETDILMAMERHLGVEYVYEQWEPKTLVQDTADEQMSITEGLMQLPVQLRVDLEYAATLLDETLVNDALDKVRHHNVTLAVELQKLANAFKYGEIVTAVQNLNN